MQPMTDLPVHARERLTEMRSKNLFTSDLSVSEFLLVKEAGFDPLGLVMGSSIYQIAPQGQGMSQTTGGELVDVTRTLYDARQLAMARMEEEALALGADGVVGVRLEVSLANNPLRQEWMLHREWREWAKRAGFPERTLNLGPAWQQFRTLADAQWISYCQQMGWQPIPYPPWARPRAQVAYALGQNVAEFVAIGTAVRHREGEHYRNARGKPFQSDLSGQSFWTLIRCGFRPVGFVMGNCVYHVPPALLQAPQRQSCELPAYTHALYDARELAIERLQYEAEALAATGIVGVTVAERQHSWRTNPYNVGNAALTTGEVIELFVVGTAVVQMASGSGLARPILVLPANDPPAPEEEAE